MGAEPLFADSAAQRYSVVAAFIALWMACGWLLHLDGNAYLLLGVPLTILFQLLVRRQPLRTLWVRGEAPYRFGWKGLVVGVVLSAIPLINLCGAAAAADVIAVLVGLCSVAGAFAAAFALRQFERRSWRPLVLCLASYLCIAAVLWTTLLKSGIVQAATVERGWLVRVAIGCYWVAQYMAELFIIEEVSFRMLDGHLCEGGPRQCLVASIAISCAWGLWHLPISGGFNWATAVVLLVLHVPYGVCLSLFWRRSGNLWVPVLSHAVGDAIRNAIVLSG